MPTSLKPSERVYQIFSSLRQKKGGNKNEDRIMAVIKYLDEEHARTHPLISPNEEQV